MANPKIKQLPSGNYNAHVYDYTTADGKRKYVSITAPTKSEVKHAIAVFIAQRDSRKIGDDETPDITLGEAINKYIESKSNILSPSTVREYRRMCRNNLQELMDIKLKYLTNETVQIAVNEEAKTHAPKTVRNSFGLVSSVISAYAPELKLNIMLPQKIKPDINIPTEDEMRLIYKAIQGSDIEVAVYLGAMCGMRRSEICALKWKDVELECGYITIRAATVLNEHGEYVEKGVKTVAGKRTIKVFTPALEKLREAHEKADGDYVIARAPYVITNHFITLLDRLSLPHYRFHDLRHYCVSVMLSLNMPKSYIADYVGHETEAMIDQVYGHILSDAKQSFIDKVDEYFIKSNAT